MYIPTWQGLSPGYFFQFAAGELPFPFNARHQTYSYVARNVIYHLFKALRLKKDETVLVPDYHHGNEVRAIRAAGASIRFYPIRRNLEPDLDALARLADSHPRALFLIHYLGWPQPVREIAALCRERGMILIEDCALSLLSETDGQPLGTFGDYAIFCLYKTLPVPNGGLLVQNRNVLEELLNIEMKPCSITSVAGRSLESMLEWVRSRTDGFGDALFRLKRAIGQSLSSIGVNRLPVGDTGFDLGNAGVGMSPLSYSLLRRFDYERIRHKRRENFLRARQKLAGRASLLREDLKDGVCPLFFPILIADKYLAARSLWQRGIGTVEFWNEGDPAAKGGGFSDAQFLRRHVLELPIHQDVTPAQVEYMADQVLNLKLHL